MSKMFSILKGQGLPPCVLSSIPFDDIAPFERQADRNHSQTLTRLNERGGLSPKEIRCVMEGKSCFTKEFNEEECAKWLEEKYGVYR